jgi:hypothetical protein
MLLLMIFNYITIAIFSAIEDYLYAISPESFA